jgi:hypothetical protein
MASGSHGKRRRLACTLALVAGVLLPGALTGLDRIGGTALAQSSTSDSSKDSQNQSDSHSSSQTSSQKNSSQNSSSKQDSSKQNSKDSSKDSSKQSSGQTSSQTSGQATPSGTNKTVKKLSSSERHRNSLEAAKIAKEAGEAFDRKDFEGSERLLLKQVDLTPDNFVPYYNLATCHSMLGDGENALNWLTRAIERGYVDRSYMDHDASIAAVRRTKGYQTLVSNWPEVLKRHRDWNVDQCREYVGDRTEPIFDEKFRLAYLSGFDAESTEHARAELTKLAEWAVDNVFPDLLGADAEQNDAWVVVLLPNRPQFRRWMSENYGSAPGGAFYTIGGVYSHDRKRLVAQDLGGTLRHEFFHVLHWRDNTRKGQIHPPWVQEGLCSLVEDYDTDAKGTLRPAASWRTNQTRRVAKAGRLPSIRELVTMPYGKFTTSRPLANYAQARTLFLYLYDAGKLKEWYATYNATFREDPTGVVAFEKTLGQDMSTIDNDYRAYVRALPEIPEEIAPGKASLGLDVDAGTGEGPVITSVVLGASAKAGLRRADVITAIEGRPTRDMAELVRVLSDYSVGDTVEVSYRRGKNHGEAQVTLVPKG